MGKILLLINFYTIDFFLYSPRPHIKAKVTIQEVAGCTRRAEPLVETVHPGKGGQVCVPSGEKPLVFLGVAGMGM